MPTIWFNANRFWYREHFYVIDRKGYDFFAKLLPHDVLVADYWVVEYERLGMPWAGLVLDPTPLGSNTHANLVGPDRAQFVTRPITGVGEFADPVIVPRFAVLDELVLPEFATVYFTHFARQDGTVIPGQGGTTTDAAGSTGLPVSWDVSELNLSRRGTYTLTGTIGYVNPTDVLPNPQGLTAEIIVEVPQSTARNAAFINIDGINGRPNDNQRRIRFSVDLGGERENFEIIVPGNNNNIRGSFVFGRDHLLYGNVLSYDIRGNGSNIRDFRIN
jgi:hypothetical protein